MSGNGETCHIDWLPVEVCISPLNARKSVLKRKPRKLVGSKIKVRVKAKRASKQSILREYGLPLTFTSSQLRYKQPIERGILWYWFSRFIRERDKHLPCISCNLMKEELHGGHFIPAGSASWDEMVFSEKNVNAECAFCNMRDKVKLKYEYNLDQKYGAGTAQALKDEFYGSKYKGLTHKNWTRKELVEKIEHYRKAMIEFQ